jgi:hypothetical protein
MPPDPLANSCLPRSHKLAYYPGGRMGPLAVLPQHSTEESLKNAMLRSNAGTWNVGKKILQFKMIIISMLKNILFAIIL